MKLFKKRPSPAMIVAMTALCVSLVGTAFADPIAEISGLNKKDKRTVRKISRNISGKVSNRRITKRAPGLNVASAQNAVIANVANASNSAINATNAKNAENAENLANQGPATYLNHGAAATATGSTALGTATQILGPVSIDVPDGVEAVRTIGTSTFSSGATNYIVWVQQDGACATNGFGFNNRQFGNTAQQESTSQTLLWNVDPGTHTYRLCASGAGANAGNRSLVIDTIAQS